MVIYTEVLKAPKPSGNLPRRCTLFEEAGASIRDASRLPASRSLPEAASSIDPGTSRRLPALTAGRRLGHAPLLGRQPARTLG